MVNLANNLISSTLNYYSIDPDTIGESRRIFDDFQKNGVIRKDCCFDDPVWYTTDEYANIGFHFDFHAVSYRNYQSVFGMDLNDFILHVKAFLCMILGKNTLSTMNRLLLDLRHIIDTLPDDIYGTSADISIEAPRMCSDFFSMLPNASESEEMDALVQAMDSYAEFHSCSNERYQRTLAEFDTYFVFNDVLEDYWKSETDAEEKLFYYPLYLWWRITGVIPLRPREFLLTKRNCLSEGKDGTHYITLRRNKLKGGRKTVSYKLADDYDEDTYPIPQTLYEIIQEYLDATKNYENTQIETLFVTDPHYRKWGQKKHSDSRYLTYMNMRTILKYFYQEIIRERYGYAIVYNTNGRHLRDGEIEYIHLGDTRHIALINIMQEGGTPVTAMLLAGHTNDVMASHYYSNVKTLIECKTYRQYRKMIGGQVQYQISRPSALPDVKNSVTLKKGRCYSQDFINGGIADCVKAIGPSSEIGYCPTCSFYRDSNISYFSGDDIYKRQVDEDCRALKEAVELVRQGKGNTEDIGEVLLRLNASSISYAQFLMEKYKNKQED